MRFLRNVTPYAFLIITLFILSCSGSLFRNYGQIIPGGEERDLETGTVRPEYRYYISGSDLYPNALVGLHREYSLDPEAMWKEVMVTPRKLRETVGFMKMKAFEYGQFQYQFDLLDPQGNKIGFWYSILTARTFIRFSDGGKVIMPTPDLETYEKLESKRDSDY